MRRSRTPFYSLAAAAAALALAACSEGTTSPTRGLSPDAASQSVTPGTNSFTIASNSSTQFCSQVNGVYTIPATLGPIASGCVAALDLTTALNAYNPGWSQPFTGSSWIGITTKGGPSSDYRPNPGQYVFQESQFTVPTGVTNATLDLHVKGDNVAAVYLNGTLLAAQTNTDCNSGTCNWNSDLHIVQPLTAGTAYTLTFLVVDLPTGFPITTGPTGGPAPQYACPTRPFQTNGTAGFTATLVPTSPNHVVAGGGAGTPLTNIGAANQAGCENPMGLDFAGTVTWTPASTTWCSPGYWKNHLDSWPTSLQNTGYNTFSAQYVRDPKTIAGNPTLLQVVSNPSTYKGPATNNVADAISNFLFGTGFGNGVESCPLN